AVWLEPASDRDRTLGTIEMDVMADGGTGTFFFGVTVNDNKGAGGVTLGPATLGSWGGSTAMVPRQQWLPFKLEAAAPGQTVMLSTTVGPASFSGSVNLPSAPGSVRLNLGIGGGMSDVVRWDNVACDA